MLTVCAGIKQVQPETLCGAVAAAQLFEIRDPATSEGGETLNTLNTLFCCVPSVSLYVTMFIGSLGPI